MNRMPEKCKGFGLESFRKGKRVTALLFSAAVIFSGPGALRAQEPASEPVSVVPSEVMSLDHLIEEAAANNPEIAAAKAEWMAAKKEITIETSLPDPEGEVAFGNNENRYSVMQTVPFLGTLLTRRKIAGKEAEAAYFQYKIVERDIRLRVSEVYYDLYYTDASIETIQEIKDLLKRFESVASIRYSNRSGSQRDVAKMQAEVSMSLEKLYRLEQRRESSAAILNAILNRDPMTPVGKAALPLKPEFDYTLQEAIELAIDNRQEIKEAEAMAQSSSLSRRVAQLAYLPDLNVGFEYEKSKMEEGTDNWFFPMKFNIPLWQNRLIPEIQKAKQLEKAGQAKLIAARNTAYQEVKDSYYKFESAMKISNLYEAAVIPQAKIALNADLAGYEAGTTDFLNLLDSERVYFNARLSYIEFFTEALKAYVDLLRCCGLDFSFQPEEQKNEQK